jgi:chemotaxis protein methyltransferase CheR
VSESSLSPITEKEFALFQELIHHQAGIFLRPEKKDLLTGRLGRRLRELNLTSFGAYFRHLMEKGEEELTHLLDAISTNETHFFREPRHFDFLEQSVFRAWEADAVAGRRSRWIRVWSAGCSTGEEPYSLAMALWNRFPPATGWQMEILATDLSTRALERAGKAVWPVEKAKEIPRRYLTAFMLKGVRSQEGKMMAGHEIRSVVRFAQLNLNSKVYAVTGLFDLVFCRNVLIYFDDDTKTRVIRGLLGHLAPGGYLFLGHAESLNGLTDRVRSVQPTVYVHAAGPAAGAPHGTAR